MRVLITGGAGFIGSHLAERLLREGAEVRVLDNLSTGREENIASFRDDVEFIAGDLLDDEARRKAVDDVEVIFWRHLHRPFDSSMAGTP